MVRSGRELERGTRTAPFPANVRASCGARFLVAFPKFARRLAFSSKELPDNRRVVRSSFEGPGRSQLSHGDARLPRASSLLRSVDDRAEVR